MKKMRNRVLVGLAALAGAMALCSPPPVRAATARYGGGSYDGYDALTVGRAFHRSRVLCSR